MIKLLGSRQYRKSTHNLHYTQQNTSSDWLYFFVMVLSSVLSNSYDLFNHIHQGWFTGSGTFVYCKMCRYLTRHEPRAYFLANSVNPTKSHEFVVAHNIHWYRTITLKFAKSEWLSRFVQDFKWKPDIRDKRYIGTLKFKADTSRFRGIAMPPWQNHHI